MLKTFDSNNKIMCLPLIFSVGSKEQIEKLITYHSIFGFSEKNNIGLINRLNQFQQIISSDKSYRIWYSNESNEYCGMLYVLSKLCNIKNVSISLINCSQVIKTDSHTVIYNISTEIEENKIISFFKFKTILDSKIIASLMKTYERNFNMKDGIRYFVDNDIQMKDIYECKKMVFSNLIHSKNRNKNKVIMMLQENMYFDYYSICYILKKLCDNSILKLEGNNFRILSEEFLDDEQKV